MIELLISLLPALSCGLLFALLFWGLFCSALRKENVAFMKPLAILPFASIAVILLFLTVNVPDWDDYDAILAYMNRPGWERFSHILDYHNEHRILTTRLASELSNLVLGCVNFRFIMLIGNALWCAFVAWYAWTLYKSGEKSLKWIAVPVLWMLLNFADFENLTWAITSVQSHAVIAFAFAALYFFQRRTRKPCLLAALLCSLLALTSSGSGLFIYPAMCLMVLLDWYCDRKRPPVFATGVFLLLAAAASLLFLHGFPSGGTLEGLPTTLWGRLASGVGFFLCFLGGAIPFWLGALTMGCAVFAAFIWVTLHVKQLDSPGRLHYAFICFLMGSAFSGALFRAIHPAFALANRYRIVSLCILIGVTFLVAKTSKFVERHRFAVLCLLMLYGVFLSMGSLALGFKLYIPRNQALRNNILLFPSSDKGLRFEEQRQPHAAKILQESINRNVYSPEVLLEPGEKRPTQLSPW